MCIQSKLDRLHTKLSMRSFFFFFAGERLQAMKERKSEKEREIDTSATKGKCRERMGEGGGVEGGREGGVTKKM